MKYFFGGMLLTFVMAFEVYAKEIPDDIKMLDSTIVDLEHALKLKDAEGVSWICLYSGAGNGFSGFSGWIAVTCAPLAGGKWRFCAGKEGGEEFICAPPGVKIRQALGLQSSAEDGYFQPVT